MAIGNSTDRFNGVVASLAIKVRCVVAAESNVASLSGITNPYSGVNIVDLDRILLVAQTDAIENGVWDVHADGPWTRAFDWDGNRDVEKGSTVWAGQSGGLDKLWQIQTDGVILPGSTAQTITILFDPTASAVGQPNPIVLPEIAGAGPDVPGEGQIWVRDDGPNVLIFTDDVGTDHELLNIPLANPIVLGELAAAGADVLGFGQIWVRDDNPNVLVFTNDLGTDTVLGSGGGGGIADGTGSNHTLRWSGSAWVESTNVEITSGGHLRIIDTSAIIRLDSTSASAGEHKTEIRMTSSFFVIQAITDAGSNGPVLLNCSRTGTSWDEMQIQTDLAIFAGSFTMEGGSIYLDQVAAALANDADHGQIWVKNTNPQELYFTDDDGTDFLLNGGGGGGMVTGISKNSGANVNAANRSVLNFIEGTNITLTITDDAGGDEVDILITAASGAGIGGSITDQQIAVGANTANDIEGDSGFIFDGILMTVARAIHVSTSSIDLTDANVALVVGGTSAALHTEFGPAEIQAKTNLTTVAALELNPLGGHVHLGNYEFDADQTVGAGQDNFVLTYDNGTGLVSLEVASGGGGGGLQGFGTWRHRTETGTPPASGQIRFDNADPSLATNLYVSETNVGSTDMAAFLALLQDGALLYLQDKSNADNFFIVEISSNTDSGTYRTFGIQNIELEGTEPAQNQEMILVGVQASGAGAEVNDLSSVVTWANVPDANITVGSVTQHVASIDHDGLLNFVAAEHIDWSVTGAEDVHTDRVPVATTSAVGGSELATTAERITGTDAARTLTPATAQKFVMVTPVVISFGGDDTWETISNAALATAGATHALIKCFCQIAPTGSAFGTQIIHLRETGSAISKATSNRACMAGEEDTSNQGITTDTNDAWVKLDNNQDFDILQDQTGSGSQIHQAWIIGYMA